MKKLERRLELPAVVAIAISAMLGAGIFVLPGLAARGAGSYLWLAYLLAGICVLPAALSKSELATAMPTSGGTYVYLDRTFGPMAGTVAGLGLWISLLLKSAFALVGFSAYLSVIAPTLPVHGPQALILPLAMLALIVFVNVRGVGKVSKAQVIVMIVSVSGLAAVAVAGGVNFDLSRFDVGAGRAGALGILATTAFVFVAYDGVTKVAAIAEEIKRPERNLPLGILLSLAIVTALYTLLTAVLVGNIPMDQLMGDERSIYTLAASFGINAIGIAAGVLGVLTMTSMANAGVLAASRFPFAMARERLLPGILQYLHPRYLTPMISILASGAVVAAAMLLLDVHRLAELASAFLILIYAAENCAVIVLRESGVQWYKPKFRAPFYPWLQGFGVLSGAALITIMVIQDPVIALGAAGVAVPGVLMYLLYGRRRTQRRGVLSQRGKRIELISADASDEATATDEATVVVSLFGKERSPEMLLELASVLADGGKVKVVHLTDIPEQTALDAMAVEDASVTSLRRRIVTMGEREGIAVDFEPTVSHDMIKTVNEITRQLHCRWLVLEWGGRSRWTLTFANPLGWLREHLEANLATFHDAGVRYIQKILVYVEPGPHDALVIHTADRLAMKEGASLTFVRFVKSGSPLTQDQVEADYLDQVRKMCRSPAQTLVVHGRNEADTIAAETSAYDLLIMGGKVKTTIWREFFGTLRDKLTAQAACSVLRLRTPRVQTHEAFHEDPAGEAREFRLLDYIEPGCIGARLVAKKKDALFQHFAEAFAATTAGIDAQAIAAALHEREKAQNTSIGQGIALPHATLNSAKRTYVGVFTSASPVDYQAPDGKGADVFFVTLGGPGDRNRHLLVLSRVATLVKNTDLLERLRAAENADEIREAIETCAEAVRR